MDAIFHIYKSSLLKEGDNTLGAQLESLSVDCVEYEHAFGYQVSQINLATFNSFLSDHMIAYDQYYDHSLERASKGYEAKINDYLKTHISWIKLWAGTMMMIDLSIPY